MTFDFSDLVTFTCAFELVFFIIFIYLRLFKTFYNKILFYFFLFQAVGIISCLLQKHNLFIGLAEVLWTFSLAWAPSLFLYVEALTKKREKPGVYLLYHGIPFLVAFFYSLVRLIVFLPKIHLSKIIGIQVFIYIIAGLVILIRYHQKVKDNFSRDESKIRNWVAVVLCGYLLSSFTSSILNYFRLIQYQPEIVESFISMLMFLIFYNILFFNAIGNPVVVYEVPSEERYQGSPLTVELANEYLVKLDKVVESRKCYLEPELTLSGLSEIAGIPSRYLSQIINQHKKKSFYDYINGLRTDYACNILLTDSRKTILEVLYESGFNSKTSFNTSFKKHTGLTPSQYKTKFQKK